MSIGADTNTSPEFLTPAEWERLLQHLGVSPREGEVLAQLLRGATEDQIALNLRLATGTVHTYLRRVYLKLGARNRAQAITRVFGVYVVSTRDAATAVTVD